jgi:hypothetical protein
MQGTPLAIQQRLQIDFHHAGSGATLPAKLVIYNQQLKAIRPAQNTSLRPSKVLLSHDCQPRLGTVVHSATARPSKTELSAPHNGSI